MSAAGPSQGANRAPLGGSAAAQPQAWGRLITVAAIVSFGVAQAAAPKETMVFGLSLRATPQAVMASLDTRYKTCTAVRSIYHEAPGETEPVIASLAINPGLTFNDIGA